MALGSRLAIMLGVVVSAGVGAGCGDRAPGAPDASTSPPPDADPTCATNVVPLVTTRDDGVADVQLAPVVIDGQPAWLALDTGSPLTFVFHDGYVEDAAFLEIGCEARSIPGYGDDAIGVEYHDGLPILGILGLDFFGATGEIDYPGGHLVRHATAPPGLEALASAPFRIVDDRGLVDVVIDDVPLRMMFDTGAHDTLWLGVEGEPGDVESEVQMADGSTWTVWYGAGTITIDGDQPRDVPVMRGLENDYIGPELEELGAQGLLGLTALGWRRIAWDATAGRFYLGPL